MAPVPFGMSLQPLVFVQSNTIDSAKQKQGVTVKSSFQMVWSLGSGLWRKGQSSHWLGSAAWIVAAFFSAESAMGQGQIQLGFPGYGGNGCPSGSASVSLSPDQTSLSILFDQYVVEAGNGRRIDRKSCNIAIPVRVPQGYSVSIFQVDYRGFNGLPSGARSTFNVEYFFAGGRGVRQTSNFRGPLSEQYAITDRLAATAVVWSACGAETNLRVNTSMMVQSNRWDEQALATVDSADISAGVIYHLQWRRCQ